MSEGILSNLWGIAQGMMMALGVLLILALSAVLVVLFVKTLFWIIGKIIREGQ